MSDKLKIVLLIEILLEMWLKFVRELIKMSLLEKQMKMFYIWINESRLY